MRSDANSTLRPQRLVVVSVQESLLRRMSQSLLGHVALFETVFSLPLLSFFLVQSHAEGTLTFGWGAYLVSVWAVGGAIVAVAFWYTVSAPLLKTRGHTRRRD